MNKYIIAFREGKILVDNPGKNEKDPLLLISFLGQLGRALSPDVKGLIRPETEREILDSLVPWATEEFGLGKKWLTVYDNPETVLAKTDFELRVDQICLYMEPGLIEEIKARDGEENFWTINHFEITKVLEPIGIGGFSKISRDLLASKVPLGPEKMEVLTWFLENKKYLSIPEEIPVKETLCMLLDYVDYPVNSSTDILRYIAYYTDNDIKEPGKLGHLKMSGALRRRACKILDDLVSRRKPEILAAEMNRYRSSWLAFTKAAHPSNPETRKVFDLIFGEDKSWKANSWGNKVRKAYDENNWGEVLSLYSQRPGEFVRHFDSLLRRFIDIKGDELQNLMKTLMASKISSKMLLNLSYYYDMREAIRKNRSFLNKKGIRISYNKEIGELDPNYSEMVQDYIKSSLRLNYSSQESLEGKRVFLRLNPEIELNLSERASQEGGIESGMQGVKIEIPKKGLLRFFLQWIDKMGNQDLDIHAQGLFGNGKLVEIGWFSAFKDSESVISHSGDIRFQAGDCAEYITVDIEKALEAGLEKIVINGHDYARHRLGSSCETYIGYSVVSKLNSEGNWSPLKSDTPFRVKLGETNEQFMCLYVIDLKEGWLKVVTEALRGATFTNTSDFERHFQNKTLNLGELVNLNVKARGGEVIIGEEPDLEDENLVVIDKSNYQEWSNLLLE